MDSIDPNDKLYLSELQTQCRFALRALQYAQLALDEEPYSYDIDEVWYHIQSFIIATGNVSKMLCVKSKIKKLEKYKIHHKRIVDEYDLPTYYFLDAKNIRNSFEHYDENIVKWTEKDYPIRGLNNIGPIDNIVSGATFHYLKHIDTSTQTLYFEDKKINLPDTYNHLINLDTRIEEIISTEYDFF